jgi:acetyltransferase (GNAT) family protein
MEDNEWSFCAMWTDYTRIGCAEALVNNKLEEDYFFNRSNVSGCRDPFATAKQIAAEIFWCKGLDCYLYDREGLFGKERIPQIDTMHVLRSHGVGKISCKIVKVDRSTLPIWVDVFCKAFSVSHWIEQVERVMSVNLNRLTLLLSFKESMPVGCAALYPKNGMVGLYCLGIIPALRRRGLAISILRHAISISKNLFLQTLDSGNLLPLYRKVGFRVAYTKKIYVIAKPVKY